MQNLWVYERTSYSGTLKEVLNALHQWGVEHQKKNMG
jgi:DNA-binding HxlR family transcriptional regulator